MQMNAPSSRTTHFTESTKVLPMIGKTEDVKFQRQELRSAAHWRGLFGLLSVLLLFFGGITEVRALSRVGDFVWQDLNTNGLQDVMEPGVPTNAVRLFDATTNLVDFTATDANGIYNFTGISAGQYFLAYTLPFGYVGFTALNSGTNIALDNDSDFDARTALFTLGANETNLNMDAGMIIAQPAFTFIKTVSNVPNGNVYYATQGEDVVYCYTFINEGNTYFKNFSIVDDQKLFHPNGDGLPVWEDGTLLLAPGESVTVYWTHTNLQESITNVAEVCALPVDFKGRDLGIPPMCQLEDAVVLVCPNPEMTPPSNITVECDTDYMTTNLTGTFSISNDICDCLITNTSITNVFLPSEDCPQSFFIQRFFRIQDSCGRDMTVTQFITVVDSTPPALENVPSNIVVSCTNVPPAPTVTATDNCDTNVPVQLSETNEAGRCEGTYRIIRIWSAADDCRNSVAATQIVDVVDLIPPVISGVPGNTNVSCDAIPPPAVATVLDSCSTAVATNYDEDVIAEGDCPNSYTIARIWTAWDACSNSVAVTQLVFVSDTTAPVILSIPTNSTIDCIARITLPDPGSVSATDNCSSVQALIVTVTTNDNGGTGLPGEPHVVQYIYTVSDECLNTSSATQTITQVCSPSFDLAKVLVNPLGRPAHVGEPVIFTISASNTGDIVIGSLRLDDTYDSTKLSFVTGQPAPDFASGGTIVWSNVGPLGIGESVTVTAEFAAVASTLPGFTTNEVLASAAWTNGQPVGTETSRAPAQVAAPRYDLVKTVVSPTNGRVNVGSEISFNLLLTNSGDIALNPDSLTDTYDPVSLSFTSSSVPPAATAPGLLIWSNLPTILAGGTYPIRVYFTGISNTYPSSSTNTVEARISITNGVPLPPKTSSVPYIVVSPVTIGDYVWYDSDTNGIQDISEHGLTNYIVRLLDVNTNLVMQSLTDGTYLFNKVLPGTYIIQFVPKTTSNVFTVQYASTNTAEDSDADPVTGMTAPITFQPGEVNLTIDAGFQAVNPVYALMNVVRGENINGGGVVTWVTEGESGTAGFVLQRRAEGGRYVNVGEIVPSFGDNEGVAQYSVVDSDAVMGQTYEYRLTEFENRGGKNYYGPYSVTFPNTPSAPVPAVASRKVATVSVVEQKSVNSVIVPSSTPVSSAKIKVSEEGIYHISADQLAAVLGRTSAEITALLERGSISLSSAGSSVGRDADASGITFYAPKKNSRYSDYNVFIISLGSGRSFGDQPVQSADPQDVSSFDQSVEFEQNLLARPDIFDDPAADVWLWKSVLSGGTFTLNFNATGCDGSASGRLTIRLKGAVAGTSHQAAVELNGKQVDVVNLSGLESVSAEVDVESLKASGNVLVIRSLGAPESIFFVNNISLRYRRILVADGNGVTFDADGQDAITIAGLNSADVDVLDVTDAGNPQRIRDAAVTADGDGNHAVSFMLNQRYGRHVVQTVASRKTPDLIAPIADTTLRNSGNQADCVIICPASLKTTAQSLATYRTGRGLKSLVVDINEIYDAFGGGNVDPSAIRSFLAFARVNWSKAPKYVVIVGQGSLDWKNALGNNDCQIPGVLARTEYGLQASDKELGDLNGDGTLEIAIGRIPAGTEIELQNAIAKIKAFEQGGGWRKKAVSLADNADRSGDLAMMSDLYAVSRMKNFSVNRLKLPSSSSNSVADIRAKLYDHLNKSGAGLFTYFGHSTHYRLASEHLLGRDDVEYKMTNADKPPVMFSAACLMNDLGAPGLTTLGETLVVSKNGAVAVVGPGQKIDVYEGSLAVSAMIAAICETKAARLGDAFVAGYNTVAAGGAGGSLKAYNLVGDPALDVSSLSRSMSAGGALVLDFDGDGRSDVGVFSASSGAQWKLLLSGNSSVASSQLGSSSAVAVAADYDGDGITDRAVYDKGNWSIINSSTGIKATKNWGWNGAVPVPADYDGDGKADIAVFDRNTARWYISSSKTNASRILQWGTTKGIPVPADYDGDGSADVAVYTPSLKSWHILQSGNGQTRIVAWGSTSSMPVPGDYDGDLKADIAVYTPANGLWQIKKSSDGQLIQTGWGFSRAAPVPADYDGDQKTDLAVYETSSGKWFIRQSSDGAGRTLTLGSSSSVPVLPQFQINRRYFPKP